MTRNDYIFANVADVDIGGTVLPQHDANGAWRPERGEDWAFLAEAWGERSLIEYKDSSNRRTQAQVEAKIAELRDWSFMGNLRVASMSDVALLLRNIEERLNQPYVPKWCAGVPAERSFSQYDELQADWWYVNCQDMLPARQLDVPPSGVYGTEDRRWEKEYLRAAFADIEANENYVCEHWFDASTQTTTNSEGRTLRGDFYAYYRAYTSAGTRWVYWELPNTPTLTLPEGAGTPTLVALFHVRGGRENVERWLLKTLQPEGITLALLESMAPEADEEEVSVDLRTRMLIVPISMRTKLN